MANRADKKRLDGLLGKAKQLAGEQRLLAAGQRCKGLDFDAMFDLVIESMPEECGAEMHEMVELVMAHAKWHEPHPQTLPNGKVDNPKHGFSQWLIGLMLGVFTLPEKFPRVVLLAWLDGSREVAVDGRPCCPVPHWRCGSCHMGLPNHREKTEGILPPWPCPVCGGKALEMQSLWDNKWSFEPAPV